MSFDFEKLVLRQVDEYEEISAAKRDARDALQRSLFDAMCILMPPGTIVEKMDRERPWLSYISTIRGHDYDAKKFEIVRVHSVTVDSAHVENTEWSAIVYAISGKGKRMNGRTFSPDGTIWVKGRVCREPRIDLEGDAYRQAWRSSLAKVVAHADHLRSLADLDQALKGD